MVFGMGRVGQGAYDYLHGQYGDSVVGVEENYARAVELRERGINCIHGDALDRDFWEQTNVSGRRMILASLSNHRENLALVKLARELGFEGALAVTSRYADEASQLEAMGCIAFNVYADVGRGFAEQVIEQAPQAGELGEAPQPSRT